MKKELHLFTRWRKAQRVLLLLLCTAFSLPSIAENQIYSNTFLTESDFNTMTVIDANNDNSTWTYNSSGYAQYTYNSSNAANDWLITPGITLEAGKTYQFDIEAWARSTTYKERLEVYLGTNNTAAGMTTNVIASTDITLTSHVTLTNNTITVTTTGTYYFGVHAISDKDRWQLYVDNLVITDVTPDPDPYPAPTNLTVSDITAHSAKTTWDGTADAQSYNLRYRKVLGENQTFFESFETFPGDWTIVDSDGDGNNWTQFNPNNFTSGGFAAYDGSYTAMSRSWNSSTGAALTPDNWLISPQVNLGGVLKYYIHDDGAGYPETYRIYVSTTGSSIANFTPLTNDMQSPNSSSWVEQSVDLSAYEGQQGYIAFRNYNCSDKDFMLIDAISITALTYGDWVTKENVTSSYTITGLDAESEYAVEVQAVYAEGNSNWSDFVLFTTSAADAMPLNLEVNNITDCTANTEWIGSQDSYNLRYRNLEFFEDFTNGLPSDWTTIDNDGDGYNWSKQSFEPSCISSASFINNVGVLTPDNWLITPKIVLNGQLCFDAWGQDSGDYAEVFRVYVSTTGTSVSDFTPISDDITTTNNQTPYTFDLSSYADQEGYIVIRHYNCTNMYWLNVTNFRLIAGEWVTKENVTSPYTITGLDAETDYEVQVQGILDNGTTDWTNSVYFTTLEAEERPMTLAELVANGEEGIRYTINEPLLAVYGAGNKLWLKDDNKYANKDVPAEGDLNYEIEEIGNPHALQAEYDQSNWIEVQLPEGVNADNFARHMIYANAITGIFDDKANPVMKGVTLTTDDYDSQGDETGYDFNYYCMANFVGSQPGINLGETVNYFFMTPKPQECAKIVWAQYDATNNKMIMPTSGNVHNLTGEVDVDLSLNAGTDPEDGKVYNFIGIIRTTSAKAGGYKVYPLNISKDVITAVTDVKDKTVVGVKYYNLAGIESDRPFDGVNIIVTTYTDGSTSATKVMK